MRRTPSPSRHENVAAAALRRRLLAWYRRHRRELPWRAAWGERTPAYQVWVSEIMLQQTRVAAAMPYYGRFLERFPTVEALALAPTEAVLAAWSGLGYYRRARQMQRAAELMRERHGGRVPLDYVALRALPGIGDYTAGAILSMAAGVALPAVDGNVARIASRLLGRELTLAGTRVYARAWVAPRRAGEFNQALMDLGAMVCLPRAPRCGQCPLQAACATRGEGSWGRRAGRSEKVEMQYRLARRGGRVWLRQRAPDEAQLAGMWELPMEAAPTGDALATVRHTITTRAITARIYSGAAGGAGSWMNEREAAGAALTGLTRKALRRLLGWKLEG